MASLNLGNDGYFFMSDNAIRYEILEGVSVGSKERFTSDILFIMLQDADFNVDNNVVGWLFGASDLITPERINSYFESIRDMVSEFETRNGLSKCPQCEYTGGGIWISLYPMSGNRYMVVDSDDIDDKSFSIYHYDGRMNDYWDAYEDFTEKMVCCDTIESGLYNEEVRTAYEKCEQMIREKSGR